MGCPHGADLAVTHPKLDPDVRERLVVVLRTSLGGDEPPDYARRPR
jgi:hypothetical protein